MSGSGATELDHSPNRPAPETALPVRAASVPPPSKVSIAAGPAATRPGARALRPAARPPESAAPDLLPVLVRRFPRWQNQQLLRPPRPLLSSRPRVPGAMVVARQH